MSSSSSANPWAWLGLLKWSLSYSDGTSPSSEGVVPMSEEDRKFLEAVMKEGIIDENERMKHILKEVTEIMDRWKTEMKYNHEEADTVEELLQELRDIVEQIDYARAFAAMNGLQFVLGCAQVNDGSIPRSTRLMCLGIIATMCQHNPPVQKKLLDMGSLKTLSDLFFEVIPENDSNGQLRARTIQAISANVRSNELAEDLFCRLDQAVPLIEHGLGLHNVDLSSTPSVLRQRVLFFLRALVTSDSSSRQRLRQFSSVVCWILDNLLENFIEDSEFELLEITLAMIEQILDQKFSVNAVLSRKTSLGATAVRRISSIRAMRGEDKDLVSNELECWERILTHLARATEDGPETPLQQIMATNDHDRIHALAQ